MATRTKSQVKAELIKKCIAAGAGTSKMLFVSERMNYSISPVTDLYYEGYLFNLRYSTRDESPFLDDQRESEIRLDRIWINDFEKEVSSKEKCLGMYMFLKNLGGDSFYKLKNKRAEAIAEIANVELEFNAIAKIREAETTDLQAVYHTVSGLDPNNISNEELKIELMFYAKNNSPQMLIDAFDNEIERIKYKYYLAMQLGIIYTDINCTVLKWSDTNKVICNVAVDEDMAEGFAKFCTEDKGSQIYETLLNKLNND